MEGVTVYELDVSRLFPSSESPDAPETSYVNPEALAYEKYQHPATPPSQILSFKESKQYQKSRLLPGITHIQFASGFQVTDTHIQDLLAAPQCLKNLEVLIIKGIEAATLPKKLKGRSKPKEAKSAEPKSIDISNEHIVTVLKRCPNLRVLHLTGCTSVNDITFKTVIKHCPHINEVKITGLPTQPGSVTTASLAYLISRGGASACSLQEINLVNQKIDPRVVTVLSNSRPELTIIEGAQHELENAGVGVSLNSLEGTYIHNSGYVVGIDGASLKYKDCYSPMWDKNDTQSLDSLRQRFDADGPEGFWSDEEARDDTTAHSEPHTDLAQSTDDTFGTKGTAGSAFHSHAYADGNQHADQDAGIDIAMAVRDLRRLAIQDGTLDQIRRIEEIE
ncbi:hypothetical protein TWF696_001666 [Orbilia brochopaga]|uniref:Uncharacterized protein n=1 Tax=Orbilia brochopaga TaxID=3140254 RepID=A0AAV9U614_9PEZI